MESSVNDYILRAEVPTPPKPTDDKPAPPPAGPRIIVRTLDGRGIASLTPPPSRPTPNGKDPNNNQPTRNIPARLDALDEQE